MKILTIHILSLCILTLSVSAENNAIQDYFAASKLSDKGKPKQAYQLYVQAAKKASNEGLPQYVFFSHYRAAYQAYNLSQFEDSNQHAIKALAAWNNNNTPPWAKKSNTTIIRIGLIGLRERYELRKLKIAQGWNYNRQAITLLKLLGYDSKSGELFDLNCISKLPQKVRAIAWRLIGRETEYLHLVGRSSEAIKLLTAAVAHSAPDTRSSDLVTRLYSQKLIGNLANIQSFIGYKTKALELYERESAIIVSTKPYRRQSFIICRLNYLHTLTSLEGASEKTIEETNKLLKESRDKKYPQTPAFERIAVQILNSKTSSAERQATLEGLSTNNTKLGDAVEVFFTTRGVLFEKAKRGEPGLDSAFNELLSQTQHSGDKKAEPRIYRIYGDWLASQSRFGEALTVYQESLRMAEEFEWVPSVPMLLAKIGATYLASNQLDAAKQIWLRMDQYIKSHPELPTYSILKAHMIHCYALLKAGRIQEGRQIARTALEYGTANEAPDYWLHTLRTPYIDSFLKKLNELNGNKTPQSDRSQGGVFIHPIALNSLSIKPQGASASFYLLNKKSTPVSGQLIVRGHGITLSDDSTADQPAFSCAPDQPISSITSNLTLEGGTMLEIPFLSTALPNTLANTSYQITWETNPKKAKQATWNIYPANSKLDYAVMEAAACSPSPFIGVPVLHNVKLPNDADEPHGFRVHSKTILRIEYRNPETGELLAVDNNGNGLFIDAGDFLAKPENNPDNPLFPTITPTGDNHNPTIEIWIYLQDKTNLEQEILLHIEVKHPQKGWTEYAQNVIHPTSSEDKD